MILALLACLASGILGNWLLNPFGDVPDDMDVSGQDVFVAFIGFALFAGAIIGSLLVIREFLKPMSQEELRSWSRTRQQGRSNFVRRHVIGGSIISGLGLLIPLVGEIKSIIAGGKDFELVSIYLVMFVVLAFAAGYGSARTWDANEAAFSTVEERSQQSGDSKQPIA